MIDLTILDKLEQPHQSGHRCADDRNIQGWFNPNAGDRRKCAALDALTALRAAIADLEAQQLADRARVHEAAHDPTACAYVAAAMVSTPLHELERDHADGWMFLAREGIEALAAWLDPEVDTSPACVCPYVGVTRDPYEPHIPAQYEQEQADNCPVHPLPRT